MNSDKGLAVVDSDEDEQDNVDPYEGTSEGLFESIVGNGSVSGGGRAVVAFGPVWEFENAGVVMDVDGEESDWDVQSKRAKVLCDPPACHHDTAAAFSSDSCATLDDRDQNISHATTSAESDLVMYYNSIPDEGNDRDHVDSDGGGEVVGDGHGNFYMDETEVRMDLTEDLLHLVFSFLEHVDLCRAAQVCKQWRFASGHEEFWRCLNFENKNISPDQFIDFCHRYPNAIEVNICGTPAVHVLAQEAMSSLRKVESLILGKGLVGDDFFQALPDCPVLNRLTISDANFDINGVEIIFQHDKLRHLQIIKCRTLRISVRCPQLEKLCLKRTSMVHALLNCPKLQELDIGSCHKLSDAGIRTAATSCPLLKSLDISNCLCATDETLREIASACPNLRVLDASYCPNISLESVRLPMLTDLTLQYCEGITAASMTAISYCSMLEALVLDGCGILTSVSLDLPCLRSISLRHCRKFVDLNLRCPMLSSINVISCPALHRISIMSNALQKLGLQKQESLAVLSLHCDFLKEVDLTECESLTNSICEVFSDGGGCPMLRFLVLDNCEGLTMVGFKNSSLFSLSLAGCHSMSSLELSCPNLQKVCLDACDHLERASFCPVGLKYLNLGICPKLSALQLDAPFMSVLELKGCGDLSQASVICPLLTSLDASFCSKLEEDCLSSITASCPLIESLILSHCTSIGVAGLSSLHRLPYLTFLDLSYTFLVNLQPVFETCLKLEVLKLQACKYLASSSLDALYRRGALPVLRVLDLAYSSICQSDLEGILACCTRLTHVDLTGCANMHDLNWGSSNFTCVSLENNNMPFQQSDRLLESLKCVGCPNIRKVNVPQNACFFHLSFLNLSLSSNLKEVHLSCTNLNFLNLSNCNSLEILELECPRLINLNLQSSSIGKDAVEAAISHCNMLETLDVRYCRKMYGVRTGKLRGVCPSLKRIFRCLIV
ncbi:F-box/LRR-repeat protein 15 [Acorus calamus]|uniref:F-box/LRR-repeat protein 15 n=1 Tax=Acorus calamus TaxID=4465 RepID=A0AAV9CFH3_ACOCL|nr:F-box/LRR-repeat protein 15 [Acorus calamus]